LTQLTSLKNSVYAQIQVILLAAVVTLLSACGTPKDTAMSRGMQNLTARYNYIYNANLILDNYQEALADTYKDNFAEILPVYTNPEKFSARTVLNPPPSVKELDAIITKAQSVIADKAFSNYIDESYLLLGKAHFFKTNYFIAEEYFDYAAKTYAARPEVEITALNWKARSLMQTNNLRQAALILDTVYTNLPSLKNHKAEPLATIAQMYIYQERYADAVILLENAIKITPLKHQRIRWTYILAQLYEKQKNYEQALLNYIKVQKSNAGFELYFNANLNKIKINGMLNGQTLNRKKQLLALLKDDKNLEYTDQIYYQIAESYALNHELENAVKYYQISAAKSSNNNYQKGLSYLRLANLNFDELRNFVQAKLYYDSTINTLPKDYAGFDLILKKSQNLEYITSRYNTIALQDTLQMIARLPETDRLNRVKALTAPAVLPQSNSGAAVPEVLLPANSNTAQAPVGGAFYFNNSVALAKGNTDFIKRWGNRKLEDNWRQSIKSSAQTTTEAIAKIENGVSPGRQSGLLSSGTDTLTAAYTAQLPLTPELLAVSNQKIIDAYYDIANFYQQELGDQQEAVKIYQLILSRFPENNHLASVYYSLYLGYKNTDAENSAKYRALVLSKFPGTVYAKTILDPDYSVKQSISEAAVIKKYNDIFARYEQKAFPAVISEINSLSQQFPDNPLNPQLYYLRAISIGRTQRIDSLVLAFKGIINLYPDDRLITPLVNDHLAYISAHMDDFRKRSIALPDFDVNEPRLLASQPLPSQPDKIKEKPAAVFETVPAAPPATKTAEITPPPVQVNPAVPAKAATIFSTEVSKTYYYVIDVADASLTLSSSRFGIGQFNRGNYAGAGLRHQLTEFDNDQLIYVGNFSSFAEAKDYSDGITPQLPQIMKVPAGIYNSFIISKENFDKLLSKDLVIKYLEFFKDNYQ
jgi:tetratricopeptide (TPR) repeat protein